jgi:hypothetical protein
MPWALVVAVIDLAIRIKADAAGTAHAAACRHHFAIRLDAQCPATEGRRAAEGAGEAEGDPEISRFIETAADGVFMVVAGDAPAVVHVLKDVGASVTIDIFETGDLVACGGVNVFILGVVGDAEDLVQAAGKKLVAHAGGIIAACTADDPDFATARAHDEPAIRAGGRWSRLRARFPLAFGR